MFRIRFMLIRIRIRFRENGSGSDSKSDLKSRKYQIYFFTFFLSKYNAAINYLFCNIWAYIKVIYFNENDRFLWFWLIFEWILHNLRIFLLPGRFGRPKWNWSKSGSGSETLLDKLTSLTEVQHDLGNW